MKHPEPSIRVTVDPTNPGQFFACCGMLKLAEKRWQVAAPYRDAVAVGWLNHMAAAGSEKMLRNRYGPCACEDRGSVIAVLSR
jgi:hypothetical protein